MLDEMIPGFRRVPRTGVIYVMHRAEQAGYTGDVSGWANLGRGSPEVGSLPDAPPRVSEIKFTPDRLHYSPIPGNRELRQKVADFYNFMYRQGKRSLYTYENVSIAGGGRLALTRIAAALGNVNMGHFLPDYTAYEELLSVFKAFIPIPILLDREAGYRISPKELKERIMGLGLSALLISNPCNPTGQLVEGNELNAWVNIARETGTSLILDEFYSHFVYPDTINGTAAKMVSAATYIDDVDRDPVIVVDGLTKNWRYPGWRISWTLGPKEVIEAIASAGSFLDGGANNPFQAEAMALLDPEVAIQETVAIQRHFRQKRDYMIGRLKAMGIRVDAEPQGTFYVWANLSGLPEPINRCMPFFEAGLQEKVITVPGVFFDVNPDGRRKAQTRYDNYCRVSFGPRMETLETGLDSLERVINKF